MLQQPSIIFQDNDIIVINKPAGMTVNRADTTKNEVTLQDWVEQTFHLPIEGESAQKNFDGTYNPIYEFSSRSGIVHRLDKETSGIILAAKNVASFIELQKQFKDRTVQKTYIALAHGAIVPSEGDINVPIGRLPFNRTHFGVVAGGREAVTHYTIRKYFSVKTKRGVEKLSLVELYPKTGRTHQIRVHLKYINHPIFSDPLYAGRKVGRDDRKKLDRLFLHAASITFLHPKTHQELHFSSSLSFDLVAFLATVAEEPITQVIP